MLRILASTPPLKHLSAVKALLHEMTKAAQQVYDKWDESDRDTYAGGGICHLIADDLVSILDKHGIEASSVASTHEQHVYVALKVEEGVYTLDLPWHIYEEGGGFSWTKIPDIEFEPRDFQFYKVTSDPDEFDKYIEAY